ncbi:hypothetical protein FPV67DRAFT_1677230 [Lyophyllum atratum]|nr:hypothetical protein FPV67DRAFT_1677230 [Lyophyllum atratum]
MSTQGNMTGAPNPQWNMTSNGMPVPQNFQTMTPNGINQSPAGASMDSMNHVPQTMLGVNHANSLFQQYPAVGSSPGRSGGNLHMPMTPDNSARMNNEQFAQFLSASNPGSQLGAMHLSMNTAPLHQLGVIPSGFTSMNDISNGHMLSSTGFSHQPQQASVLQQLENRIAALQAQQDEQKAIIEQQAATLLAQGQPGAAAAQLKEKRKEIAIKVQALVRLVAKDLLQMEKTRGPDGRVKFLVPGPLDEGEPPRVAEDGVTRLWNPIWDQGVTIGINAEFVAQIVKVVLQREKDHPTPEVAAQDLDGKLLQTYASVYFKSLRQAYKAQTTEAGRVKRDNRNAIARRRNRKSTKADILRQQVPTFRAIYGEEDTVGVDELVVTDYMSSEHSDPGNVSLADWQKHRKKFIQSNNGFEVRKLRWRSAQLNRILARLYKMFRVGEKNPNEPEASENVESSSGMANGTRVPRFSGLPENDNMCRPPLLGRRKLKPYVSSVSTSWLKKTDNESTLPMDRDPEDFTIFALRIPDTDFEQEDLDYLADDED